MLENVSFLKELIGTRFFFFLEDPVLKRRMWRNIK